MTPVVLTARHAAARARVRLPTGRLGTLVYMPKPELRTTRGGRHGAKAVVRLDGGAHVSLPPTVLELIETP